MKPQPHSIARWTLVGAGRGPIISFNGRHDDAVERAADWLEQHSDCPWITIVADRRWDDTRVEQEAGS